jgi:predicted RNA-binding protein (virulence factor B family)
MSSSFPASAFHYLYPNINTLHKDEEDQPEDENSIPFTPGDEVELLVGNPTPLGVNVLINDEYEGLLFHEDIFRPIDKGDRIKGYIKKVREDGKIDVTLERFGYRKVEGHAEKIMEKLKANKGVLHLTDKSNPNDIISQLHMSKKVFKKAIGALYKQKLIRIEQDGIYLAKPA